MMISTTFVLFLIWTLSPKFSRKLLPLVSSLTYCLTLNYLLHSNLPIACSIPLKPHFSAFTMTSIILAMDRGEVTSLILLHAFDTVDHSILLHRLQHWFGLHGSSLDWFSFYLTSRSQAVSIQNSTSSFSNLSCDVPQGSFLGPLLFPLYTTPLGSVISKNSIKYHLYNIMLMTPSCTFLSLLKIQLLHLKYSPILSLTYSPGWTLTHCS